MSSPSVEWWPSRFFVGKGTHSPYAVLILNQPVSRNALKAVIGNATLVVCADGGANRLFDEGLEFAHVKVDAIVGDLDSLRPEVEEAYRRQGVIIEKDPDQYRTDFTKCLRWIRQHVSQHLPVSGDADRTSVVLDVVAIGGLGGRVDQGFSQIHHLYLAQSDVTLLNGRIYLLSEQSLSFVLDAGMNVVHVEPDTFNENVGIIPILGPTIITTKGFEWDVTDWKTEFGGQMSTSNHIWSERLHILVTGKRPLFTMELGDQFRACEDEKTSVSTRESARVNDED